MTEFYEQLYDNKLENVEEILNFLENNSMKLI